VTIYKSLALERQNGKEAKQPKQHKQKNDKMTFLQHKEKKYYQQVRQGLL